MANIKRNIKQNILKFTTKTKLKIQKLKIILNPES